MPSIISIRDLNFTKWKLVKETVKWFDDQDHSRWVFRTKHPEPLFLKLWNPTYVRSSNMLSALSAGFYDSQITPALKSLVFHNGICRGYVMHTCKPFRKMDADFYRLLREKTEATGFFQIQFSRFHLMLYKDQLSLIDLEAVYPLAELPALDRLHCVFDDPDYEQFVRGLFCRQSGESQRTAQQNQRNHTFLKAASFPFRKSKALCRRAWNFAAITWGTIRNHTELIET